MIPGSGASPGPRFRYIVAGERGAVEYVILGGFPLTISYHSPQPLDGVRPVPCDVRLRVGNVAYLAHVLAVIVGLLVRASSSPTGIGI
jgi:hypothetical protein